MIGHQAVGDQIRYGQDIPLEIEQKIQVIPILEKYGCAVHSPIEKMIILSGIKRNQPPGHKFPLFYILLHFHHYIPRRWLR